MDAGAKRKRDYESGADVIGAALSRMEAAAAPPAAAPAASFVPAPAFAGARPGYYFTRGAHGVGYYADARGGGASASRGGSMMPLPPPRSADAQVRYRPACIAPLDAGHCKLATQLRHCVALPLCGAA